MRCLFPLGFLVQESQRVAVYQCVVYSHWAFWYSKVNVFQYINALFIPIGLSGTGKSTFCSISMRCLLPLGILVQESQGFEVSQCVIWYQRGFWYRKINVSQYINTLFDLIGISCTGKSTLYTISMHCVFSSGFLVKISQRFTISVCCLFPLGVLVQES